MDYSSVIEKVKSSIAYIIAFDEKNKIIGTGSGFVFKKKGILVTCNHVIENAKSLLIKFPDSEDDYESAKVVIHDEEHDLALLKFDDDSREPLPLGDLSKVYAGIPVLFSGYPFISRDLTTHQGIISAIVKDPTGIISYLIDGTVNAGNSGCPLMNEKGEVIGIVDATNRARGKLLEKVERMTTGAISLYNVDLVEIYQALINNVQIGSGHAVPVSYVPDYKESKELEEKVSHGRKKINNKNGK